MTTFTPFSFYSLLYLYLVFYTRLSTWAIKIHPILSFLPQEWILTMKWSLEENNDVEHSDSVEEVEEAQPMQDSQDEE